MKPTVDFFRTAEMLDFNGRAKGFQTWIGNRRFNGDVLFVNSNDFGNDGLVHFFFLRRLVHLVPRFFGGAASEAA
jgi:hypothetical protein